MVEPLQWIPIENRKCVDMIVAGISGPNGSLPLCVGRECNKYEACLANAMEAIRTVNEYVMLQNGDKKDV